MDALGGSLFCVFGFVLIAIVILLFNAIRIVPEYQRLVVFRLGRVMGKPQAWYCIPDPRRGSSCTRRPS